MKKILFGLLAIVALSLSSCGGSCENTADANDTIDTTTVVADSIVVDSVAVLDTVAK